MEHISLSFSLSHTHFLCPFVLLFFSVCWCFKGMPTDNIISSSIINLRLRPFKSKTTDSNNYFDLGKEEKKKKCELQRRRWITNYPFSITIHTLAVCFPSVQSNHLSPVIDRFKCDFWGHNNRYCLLLLFVIVVAAILLRRSEKHGILQRSSSKIWFLFFVLLLENHCALENSAD